MAETTCLDIQRQSKETSALNPITLSLCNHGIMVLNQHLLENAEVKVPSQAARSAICRPAWSSVRSPQPATEQVTAKFHRDDERLRFSLGDQIIHD